MEDRHKLNLKDLRLPAEEIHELYGFVPAIFYLASHDVSSPLNAMTFNLAFLSESLEKLLPVLASGKEVDPKKIERLERYIGIISSEMRRLHNQVGLLFGNRKQDELFIAKLVEVVEAVSYVHYDTKISVTESSPKSLEILFMRNILSAIVSELILNVKRVVGTGLQIVIHWEIDRFKFSLEVHDNGPGAILKDGLPVETVGGSPSPSDQHRKYGYESGLSLIRRALYRIGGQISFAHSSRTEGMVAKLSFPVRAYFLEGVGCEYIGRPQQ